MDTLGAEKEIIVMWAMKENLCISNEESK